MLPKRYEAEVPGGIERFAVAELRALGASIRSSGSGSVTFDYGGPPSNLQELRRCSAVYALLAFDVPRPKALLGHAQLSRLLAGIGEVKRQVAEGGGFSAFRFGAAGSDSKVFARLAQELSSATGLSYDEQEGELLLRVRPERGGNGWEVLLRLTPRPLSARSWRVCNRPGGLNAAVAAAAHDLLGTSRDDRYLNLMCGSGTLLVERCQAGPWSTGVGVDRDAAAVECSVTNLAAAGLAGSAQVLCADARDLPLDSASFDRVTVDLPWGDAVGGHLDNERLYPEFLSEAARVAAPGALMLAITHELRLFDKALAVQGEWTRQGDPLRVSHGGHRPGLYLLTRDARV